MMSLWRIVNIMTIAVCWIVDATTPTTENHFIGPWIQVYSNYFVQSTSEIDWHCIRTNFTVTRTILPSSHRRLRRNQQNTITSTILHIQKTAFLHNINEEPITSSLSYVLIPSSSTDDTLFDHWYHVPVGIGAGGGPNTTSNTKETFTIRKKGPVVNDQLDYLIVTHANNISLFVFARDYHRFFSLYNDDVLSQLYDWQYIGLYKSPLSSFTKSCI